MINQPNYDFQDYNMFRSVSRRAISKVGRACGGAVVAFIVLGSVISGILFFSDGFYELYSENNVFSMAFYALISVGTLFLPFCAAYSSLKKVNIVGELPFGEPYNKANFFLLIPICVMVCIIGSIFTGLFSTFVDILFGIEFTQPDDVSDYNSAIGIFSSVFATAVVPAFVEEFAIRGVVLQSLRKYGDKFAILMSSLVFALMHGNMIQIPFAFIAGLALGYAAVKTGSLWTGIIIHFINNSMAVLSMISVERLSAKGSSMFAMGLYAVVFLIGLICLAVYCKRNNRAERSLPNADFMYGSEREKAKYFIFNAPMIISIVVLVIQTATYINMR